MSNEYIGKFIFHKGVNGGYCMCVIDSCTMWNIEGKKQEAFIVTDRRSCQSGSTMQTVDSRKTLLLKSKINLETEIFDLSDMISRIGAEKVFLAFLDESVHDGDDEYLKMLKMWIRDKQNFEKLRVEFEKTQLGK